MYVHGKCICAPYVRDGVYVDLYDSMCTKYPGICSEYAGICSEHAGICSEHTVVCVEYYIHNKASGNISMVVSSFCLSIMFFDAAILTISYHNKWLVVVVCSRTANLHNDLCMTVSIVSVCIYVGVVSVIRASVHFESCVVCIMIANYVIIITTLSLIGYSST